MHDKTFVSTPHQKANNISLTKNILLWGDWIFQDALCSRAQKKSERFISFQLPISNNSYETLNFSPISMSEVKKGLSLYIFLMWIVLNSLLSSLPLLGYLLLTSSHVPG